MRKFVDPVIVRLSNGWEMAFPHVVIVSKERRKGGT